MFRSFVIKGLMLGVTISLLMWMGRPTPPERERQGPSSQLGAEAGAPVSVLPENDSLAEARTQPASSQQASPRYANAKVDLNRATVVELERLPTIGQVLAERIVKHRNTNGLYVNIEQLLEVKGIGHIRLQRLRPLLTLSRNSPEGVSADRKDQQSLPLEERAS